MYIKKNTLFIISIMIVLLAGTSAWSVWAAAGTTDSSAPPGSTSSYTLNDIYNRLNDGTAGTPSTFTEPSVAPGTGTMYTLDSIYNLIGERAPVPKTGQTACWNASGTSVACNNTGQDGDLQRGVTWPNPRFTNNLDGTVTDNLTGLIWLTNANCAAATRTWATALTDVASLNATGTMNGNNCGDTSNGGSWQTDWRLPNVREMQSLVHYGFNSPALPNTAGTGQWSAGDPFTAVQSSIYWSSTSAAFNTSYAWHVPLFSGYVSYVLKSNSYFVWPVRGGQ